MDTADRTVDLMDHPVFLGSVAVIAVVVLCAVGRWLPLMRRGIARRTLTRSELFELMALSVCRAAPGALVWSMMLVFADAAITAGQFTQQSSTSDGCWEYPRIGDSDLAVAPCA